MFSAFEQDDSMERAEVDSFGSARAGGASTKQAKRKRATSIGGEKTDELRFSTAPSAQYFDPSMIFPQSTGAPDEIIPTAPAISPVSLDALGGVPTTMSPPVDELMQSLGLIPPYEDSFQSLLQTPIQPEQAYQQEIAQVPTEDPHAPLAPMPSTGYYSMHQTSVDMHDYARMAPMPSNAPQPQQLYGTLLQTHLTKTYRSKSLDERQLGINPRQFSGYDPQQQQQLLSSASMIANPNETPVEYNTSAAPYMKPHVSSGAGRYPARSSSVGSRDMFHHAFPNLPPARDIQPSSSSDEDKSDESSDGSDGSVEVRKPQRKKIKGPHGEPLPRVKRVPYKILKQLPSEQYDELVMLEVKQLRARLVANQQPCKGPQMDLMARIADAYLHGCLPVCPKCHSYLVVPVVDGGFVCQSSVNPETMGRCDFAASSVERRPWRARDGCAI